MSDPDLTGMDPQARRFLTMVALGGAGAGQASADARRRSFATLMRWSQPPAEAVDGTGAAVRGCGTDIALRVYVPRDLPPKSPGLIYFHGGGLVAGSLDTHDALCRFLAIGGKCRVVAVDYRLAPVHPFPAAPIDALLATRAILRDARSFGLDVERIAVGGDSGGGTLAAIVAQVMGARLKAQVLLCPVLDFAGAHASRRDYARGFLLDEETMANDLAFYAPRRPHDDPRISPLRAQNLRGVPHTVVHTAGFDPLRDEGDAYAARLRDAGIAVVHRCHPTLIHHFYGLDGLIAAARSALSTIAGDIRDVLA